MSRRVIVVGGTGAFGQRFVEGLAATTDFSIVIASRDRVRGAALAATLPAGRAEAVCLDTRTVTPEALRALDAFAIVDAAGPFQGADYRLARAAIAAGLHYLDFADARDFVAGFVALDAGGARRRRRSIDRRELDAGTITCVLDYLTAGWRRIDRVEIAISPGNRAAPRGLAVIRSVLCRWPGCYVYWRVCRAPAATCRSRSAFIPMGAAANSGNVISAGGATRARC